MLDAVWSNPGPFLLLAALAGAGLATLIATWVAGRRLAALREAQHALALSEQRLLGQLKGQHQHMRDLEQRLAGRRQQFEALQERYQVLEKAHAALGSQSAERETHLREQVELLADTRKALAVEFEHLAGRIFEEKGKTFTATSQSSLDVLLKPFREQIDGFQRRVNEVHDASLRGHAELAAELRKVMDVGLRMSDEANNLSVALKGDSQQLGAWGEAQLQRTLELSGLVEGDHFETQSSFRDAEGRQRLTDYLVRLPGDKHIIIDSKMSLAAWERAVSADTPEAARLALDEHVRAVRRHIDDLSGKDYTQLVGMRSPSFVLMFMPIESAYIEALKHQRELFGYGYDKGVVLVSHTTLIPILRTVANLWVMERSNAEAREIGNRAAEIHNQVCLVAERLQRLGNTLTTVSNHYNSTVTAVAGQQGLFGKVDRFGQLSARVRELPGLETIHPDFESERLAMIVEPLPEEQTEAEGGRAAGAAD